MSNTYCTISSDNMLYSSLNTKENESENEIITFVSRENVKTFLFNYFFVNDIPDGIEYEINE